MTASSRSARVTLACLLAIAGVLASSRPAEAAKLLEVRVEQGNAVRLRASFGVPDRSTPAENWRRLGELSLEETGPLAASEDSPEISMASGRVTILWKDRIESTAEVSRLRLVREAGTKGRWRLPPDEVERTALAANLELPRSDWWTWPVKAVVIAVASILATWLWRSLSGPRLPKETPES